MVTREIDSRPFIGMGVFLRYLAKETEDKQMTIFIGGAWPYANGSLHLGHVSSLLPGDIIARHYRQQGEQVLYVSGSDCHGTPIAIRANQEGVSPGEIAEKYHREFEDCFQKLGFTYDLYTRTDDSFHHQVVQELFLTLLDKGHIYMKSVEQVFCTTCVQFLPDRYVEGTCPHCGQVARGDQCDYCSSLLDPVNLIEAKCKLCGSSPELRYSDHYYLALSQFQQQLEQYVQNSASLWRENAVHLSERYLQEGLHDRAATRDLPWGVDVPLEDCSGKKIYVWIEAISGYLSASKQWAEINKKEWEPFWSEDSKAYYVHGKDNIPFHSLILPALLLGAGNLHLPDYIVSNEYLTLEGKKISTSRNWAVWLPYILEHYHPDSIRYFLTINAPEKRDADFSWREFIHSHNGELLGAFGNFVNRNLAFIHKSFDDIVPEGSMDQEIKVALVNLYGTTGTLIEQGKLKEAIESIFSFIRSGNKYVDDRKPWAQLKTDRNGCANTLHTCVQIIANLANLLEPFLPFSCDKIREFLSLPEPAWTYVEVSSYLQLKPIEPLYERIDPLRIQEEYSKLGLSKLKIDK